MFYTGQFNCKQLRDFYFLECLIEATWIICQDKGQWLKRHAWSVKPVVQHVNDKTSDLMDQFRSSCTILKPTH